ncbi:hypothetical protein VIOR3934_16006 [Vibrio orientalis CIP 102891 = ATCC 33934]|uniref:O-succinylbenzoic acid--CoA ligase n=1 Tax=Vibrio orientalis CIP 102891 = ATCC 33934 TaxID=675816 RepID=C9QIK9_VIBOR|nr:hypothetical protein [Vibrio orientalis]EEX92736.1 hypothetical protein VIA_003381 [Vibrio orientalis CIP 102891 = ATCC 33934]EGU52522.1 hypothetical protein VIOR3934_16006 [Vibrio orientalis CIP 102891 = ATCC 33934]
MIKAVLVIAVILQIVVAVQSDGLVRALAELSAFLLVSVLVLSANTQKRKKLIPNADEF